MKEKKLTQAQQAINTLREQHEHGFLFTRKISENPLN